MTVPAALPAKPALGAPCNGCGYCCSREPCALAQEFLRCTSGPCVALERQGGKTLCGLVRNPLGYLFQAAHPGQAVAVLEDAPALAEGARLSRELAEALGIGRGCDSLDDDESAAWPALQAALPPQP